MVELRPLEERVRYYQALARLARERSWNPGRIGLDFKKQFGKYPSRAEMGTDADLWTQHDDSVGRRVWVQKRNG